MPKVNAEQITTAETLFRQFAQEAKQHGIRITHDPLTNEDPFLIRRWSGLDEILGFNLVIRFESAIEEGDPVFNVVIYGQHKEYFHSTCRITKGGWPSDFSTQDGAEIKDVDQKEFFRFIKKTLTELKKT